MGLSVPDRATELAHRLQHSAGASTEHQYGVVVQGEIAEAAWFTRAEVRAALEEGDWSSESTSRLLLPGSISIAREIIESWAYHQS